MPAGDNVVEMVIRAVDESAPVLQRVETNVKGMGTAGAASAKEFDALRAALAANTAALEHFHGNVSRANGGLESMHGNMRFVSGTAREFGLNLGYSMRAFLAESPAVIASLKAMEGIFVGLAVVDIGVQAIEGLKKVYDEFVDVGHAVDDYKEKAGEAARQKLFETASAETTIGLLRQVQGELDQLDSKKHLNIGQILTGGIFFTPTSQGLTESPVTGYLAQKAGFRSSVYTGEDAKTQARALQEQAGAQEHLASLQHEQAVAQIENAHAGDEVLGKEARISAEKKKQIDLAAENFRYTQQQQQTLHDVAQAAHEIQVKSHVSPDQLIKVPQLDQNAGWQQYVDAQTKATKEANAKQTQLARQEQEEVIRMQNEALDAGMRGEALHDEERQQAIDAITRKRERGELTARAAAAETEAVDMKFHNQKMMRLEEEEYATKRIQEQAAQAGLTGIPRIQAETQSRINDLTANPANAGLPDEEIKKRRTAFEQEGNQQIQQAREQFTDKITQLSERADDQMLNGYARIGAQEKASLTELERAYSDFYGKDQSKWEGYQDVKTRIEQDADRERLKYAEDVNRQVAQTEAEAARTFLPAWQASQQKIVDDYQQRLAKIREDVQQQVVTEQQGAREAQAAWALANSQMERQAEETRDHLAGQLQSLFDNPARYMKDRAKQMMFEILANWTLQLTEAKGPLGSTLQTIFGMGAPASTSANPGSVLAGMFGLRGPAHAADSGTLASAGTTLYSAGATLSSSGSMLASAAGQLSQAATMWEAALSGGGASSGQIGQAGALFSGWTGSTGGGALGGEPGAISLPGAFAGASGGNALSETLGIPAALGSTLRTGGPVGAIGGLAGTAGQLGQLAGLFGRTGANTAPALNPGGGLQPSDLPPTSSSGVVGTVPDSSTGFGATDASGGITAGQGIGGALAGISTAVGLAQAWSQGNTLGAVLTGAMGGAGIGLTFGGPVGAAIGAGVGALVGFVGSLFSDHGASKARKYNTDTVIPTLQQLMWGFGGGQSDYDQASLTINNLQIQAQKQTQQWGSGAVGVYRNTIVPEIQNAQNQINREGAAGRANVTTTAAQFHTGGWVTGNEEGMILALAGEHVMNRTAASANAPWLDAMNRGFNMTTAIGSTLMARNSAAAGTPRETGAAMSYVGGSTSRMPSPGGAAGDTHVHIHAWDSRDVSRWLRGGGAMQIQTELNRNASRYAGKALSS